MLIIRFFDQLNLLLLFLKQLSLKNRKTLCLWLLNMIQLFFKHIQSLILFVIFIIETTLHWQPLLMHNVLNYILNLSDIRGFLLLKALYFQTQAIVLTSQLLQIRKTILLDLISLLIQRRWAFHLSWWRISCFNLLFLFCRFFHLYFLLRTWSNYLTFIRFRIACFLRRLNLCL